MATYDSLVRRSALVLAVAAASLLSACGAPPAGERPGPTPAPTSTSTPPATPSPTPDPADRESTCADLKSRYGLHTLQLLQAIGAEPARGPEFRAGVAEAYVQLAQGLELVVFSMPVDAQLAGAVVRWADANREIAEYVRITEPSGDNVLEFGPGNDREIAARDEVEELCGPLFG